MLGNEHGGVLGDQTLVTCQGVRAVPEILIIAPSPCLDSQPNSCPPAHPTPMNWSPCPVATEALDQMTVDSKLHHLPVSRHCHHLRGTPVVHFPSHGSPRSLHQPKLSPWGQTHSPREHLGPSACPLSGHTHGSRCIYPSPSPKVSNHDHIKA